LLDVATPVAIPAPFADPVDKNYLIVGSPSFDHEHLFPSGRFLYINLASVNAEEWWKSETKLDTSPQDLPVVVDCFEANKEDASWNQRKLRLVERVISKGTRHVLILSSIDPVDLPLSNGKLDGNLAVEAQVPIRKNATGMAGGAARKSASPEDKTKWERGAGVSDD